MGIVKVLLSGANGRMGLALESLINKEPKKFKLTSKFNRICMEKTDNILKACKECDVIIDFSHPDNLKTLLEISQISNTPILIGTTGFTKKHMQYIENASSKIPVLYAPNTSIGANLIAELAAQITNSLKDYDIEILETHHKNKKDAPSGTALMIGKEIANAKNINFEDYAVFDRANKESSRRQNEIGFSSIRAGSIFGEHEVIFAGENEVIKLSTCALSRDVFAEGALKVARWVAAQKAGLYSMKSFFKRL